jgi:hypothetical protein
VQWRWRESAVVGSAAHGQPPTYAMMLNWPWFAVRATVNRRLGNQQIEPADNRPMFSFLNKYPWPWVLVWTIGLWLAALSFVGVLIFATVPFEPSDYLTAFAAAGVSATLATLGTIWLIRIRAKPD